MGDIRYVCLSDMHLGQDNSLLTNLKEASPKRNNGEASPVLKEFSGCLRDLIGQNTGGTKPTLILNGDILELALCQMHEAAMVFQRFIELVMPPGGELFETIVYLPGNHDHHLWELARETQYVDFLKRTNPVLNKEDLKPPYHTSSLFALQPDNQVPGYFLTSLVQMYPNLKDFPILTAYPDLGVFNPSRTRLAVFSHGHYIESIYRLVSELFRMILPDIPPVTQVWGLEEENFAWIDFFWSAMGRSGKPGEGVERIYESLRDKKARDRLLGNLAASLAKKYDLPGWGDWMEEKPLKAILSFLADRAVGRERHQTGDFLGDDARSGLWSYAEVFLKNRLAPMFPEGIGVDLSFVFGHTHKPYEDKADFVGYDKWVALANTGGWVVETEEPSPIHGASVALLDEDLNLAVLRCYNEGGGGVRLADPKDYHEASAPFVGAVKARVEKSQAAWDRFSEECVRSIKVRRRHLIAGISRARA